MKTLRLLFRTLLLLLLLAAAAIFFGLQASKPQLEGELALSGLSAPVSLQRDAQGSVTILGDNRLDLARATGFAHGQDRYFQMDLSRRDAAGELSELFGPAALAHDIARRAHELRRLAEQLLAQAPAEDVALLKAYTEGVNAGLDALAVRPFEYVLLQQAPLPWRMQDSLLVSYAMWFDLTDEHCEIDAQRALIADSLPAAVAEFVFPRGSAWDAAVDGSQLPAAPMPGAEVLDLREAPALMQLARRQPETHELGSNNWAVAAARSKTGRAMLADDMHLGLRLPHIWYRLRLQLRDPQALDISGLSLPGLPLIVAGSNTHVAWGFTNSYGQWCSRQPLAEMADAPPVETWTATIRIKGRSPLQQHYQRTALGPVLVNPAFDGRAEQLQWLAHQPGATNLRLAWLEQARNLDEALETAALVGIPPQNFVAADRDGRIGWTIAGRIPRRDQAGRLDHVAGFLAPADYPRIVDPDEGLLWTANARVVGGQMLAQIGDGGYALGARAAQIRDGLRAKSKLDLDDMRALQLDDRALFLQRWQQQLLASLDTEALRRKPLRAAARQHVAQWGERAAVASVGYRIVRGWREELRRLALSPLIAPLLARDPDFPLARFAQSEAALWALIEQQPAHLLSTQFEDWQALKLAALDAVLAQLAPDAEPLTLAKQTWGARNRLRMQHPLSQALPLLSPLLDMALSLIHI